MVESQSNKQDIGRALSNSEVKSLIEMHLTRRTQQNITANAQFDSLVGNEQGNEMRQQTLDYIERFSDFEENKIIDDIRRYYFNTPGVKKMIKEREYVLMWNLMPGNYEEAAALIPSLSEKPKNEIDQIINFLNDKRGYRQDPTQ